MKLLPFVPPTGLAAAGAVRMPLGKYSFYSLTIILVTSGLFLVTGYYCGEAYEHLVRYQEYALAAIAGGIILASWIYKKGTVAFARKIAPGELK